MVSSALSTLLTRRAVARNAAATAAILRSFSVRGFCNGVSSGSACGGEGEPGFPLKVEDITDSEGKAGLANDPLQYDVAIVGGGMVGLALACGLSSIPLTKHLRVAIIDPNPAFASRGYLARDSIPDSRVSTVTPATISFFKDIGAWVHVQQQRHTFFDKMQVWDYTGLGYTRYNAKDVGKDYLGCVVENKVLCNSLLLCLQRADTMKTIFPARLTTLTFPKMDRSKLSGISSTDDSLEQKHLSHLAKLELSDGQILYSKLVVGADGAKSRVRETVGIKTTGWNYSQSGLICTVEHLKENQCAWQRFLPSGPIALLPIGDNYGNIVWTMNPGDSERHKTMSEKEFVESVNHALYHGYGPHSQSTTLDNFVQKLPWFSAGVPSAREPFELPPRVTNLASERMAFPLSLMHAHEYASRRVVLIGDAAHTVHPLAGQGVNLGFGDASTLANVIAEGLSVGNDIGEIALLKRYEKQRKAANVTMMAILDAFQKAYSIDLGPVNLVRAAAFHGAQFIAPLKRNIISYAMGEQKLPLFT